MGDVRSQQQSDDDGDRIACVPYVPFRCPRCGRHKPFTYAVRGRLRYHQCQRCRQRYRSYELGAASVVGWSSFPSVTLA